MKGCERMIEKERCESRELLLLRSLNSRKKLLDKERQYYLSLEKGYEGELLFDERIRIFPDTWLFLNDLILEHYNSYFQIDSLGFYQEYLYLFEIKNLEGDYILEGDKWKTIAGKEIKNPFHQLQRCETSLRRFLQDRGLQVTIKPYLIFINPTFTLYQAPPNSSIIFPTQLHGFLENLKRTTGRLGAKPLRIAEILKTSHLEYYPNPFIPSYHYQELQKGILCGDCRSFLQPTLERRGMSCPTCDSIENLETTILRSVAEFQLLFPAEQVSTSAIYEWCDGVWSRKTIQRVLAKQLTCIKYGKSTHYINSNK